MIYLLKGEDYQAKEKKIEEIKNKVLTKPDAKQFDFDVLDAARLNPEDFKKALITLPVVVKQRLILIRHFQKLSSHNQTLILDVADSPTDPCILICDCDEFSKKGFLSKLAAKAKVLDYSLAKKINVFDMTKAIEVRNSAAALKLLSVLLKEGNHPLQIMGGLVWFWGRLKRKISPVNFQKGLRELQEADLNIKRSRLHPEYTLEVLITKLSLLVA